MKCTWTLSGPPASLPPGCTVATLGPRQTAGPLDAKVHELSALTEFSLVQKRAGSFENGEGPRSEDRGPLPSSTLNQVNYSS